MSRALALVRRVVRRGEPPLPYPALCRDRDDDAVLALASEAAADCLVSGDHDLVTLGHVGIVPIIPPQAFWALEVGRRHE
ncbi:MAG: putative toxin-antitoxin system toxin component, PIN family [Acidobacteriota bacterium]